MAVYFIAGGELVKIGYTQEPTVKQRLNTLQLMCPVPLTLLGVLDGEYQLESALHDKFAADRQHGEWFARTPELDAIIKLALSTDELCAIEQERWRRNERRFATPTIVEKQCECMAESRNPFPHPLPTPVVERRPGRWSGNAGWRAFNGLHWDETGPKRMAKRIGECKDEEELGRVTRSALAETCVVAIEDLQRYYRTKTRWNAEKWIGRWTERLAKQRTENWHWKQRYWFPEADKLRRQLGASDYECEREPWCACRVEGVVMVWFAALLRHWCVIVHVSDREQ